MAKGNQQKVLEASDEMRPSVIERTEDFSESGSSTLVKANEVTTNILQYEKALAAEIVKSGISPFRKEEDALVAILLGKDLGLKPMVAINNIVSVEGKASMSIHLMMGLAQRAGVTYEVIEDYEPIYPMFVKGADGKAVPNGRVCSYSEMKDIEKPAPQPTDARTRIKFSRKLKDASGEWVTQTFVSDFEFSTAVAAKLTNKPNWAYIKTMMFNRAASKGLRAIAADVIWNMMELSELADMYPDVKTTVDATGNIKIIEVPAELVNNQQQEPIQEAVVE